jgi:hypothetical protein
MRIRDGKNSDPGSLSRIRNTLDVVQFIFCHPYISSLETLPIYGTDLTRTAEKNTDTYVWRFDLADAVLLGNAANLFEVGEGVLELLHGGRKHGRVGGRHEVIVVVQVRDGHLDGGSILGYNSGPR